MDEQVTEQKVPKMKRVALFLFEKYPIPIVVLIFAFGAGLIFISINREQNLLINTMVRQMDHIFQSDLAKVESVRQLAATVFEQSRTSLQHTFFMLMMVLGLFLLFTIAAIAKLKSIATKLSKYAERTQKINLELQEEIENRLALTKNLEDANVKLSFQSLHDKLTGLPNRQLFEDRLRLAIANSKRNKLVCAIVFLDLDKFKAVNDTMGHDAGDVLLKEVVNRILPVMRASDTFARIGGDEFVFILTQLDKSESAVYFCERVADLFKQSFNVKSQEIFVGASLGISVYPDDGDDPQSLVKNADTAMYYVKSHGRNNIQFYRESMNVVGQRQLQVRALLKAALTNNEFMLNYQPIYDVEQHKMVGLEVFTRWKNAELGMVSPSEFFTMAENLGITGELNQWIVSSACKQFQQWVREGFNPLNMYINLTPKQILAPTLLPMLEKLVQQYEIKPESLVFEFTESLLTRDTEKILSVLKSLKKFGARLALDDFGTGVSSLNVIKDYSIDIIKIENSLINSMLTDPQVDESVSSIITMANLHHVPVIAEAVENEKQKDHLLQKGCHLMQGYYFSHPKPASEFH